MGEFCVYMHVNKANGKRYIGITSDDPLKRWANGRGYYRNKHFSDAIDKYGWNNFEHIILFSGLTKEEACEIERFQIQKYQTQDKTKGYNLTDGGEHFRHSEESKRLMSRNRMGLGRKKRTPEQIAHIKAAHAGGADAKRVICIDTGEVFRCINDAARAKGINKKGISGCCRGVLHYNTAGGLRWKFEG